MNLLFGVDVENVKNQRTYEPADDSLLQIVWRQKGLIVLVIAIALGIAGIYVLVTPKTYTAAARIQVQRALPMGNERQNFTSDNPESFIYQEAELIKSAPVLYMALGGPGMDELQIFENVKNTMAFLKREVNVDVGKRDGFITVTLAYKNPDEASKVVNNIIESYKAFKSKQRRDMASGVLT